MLHLCTGCELLSCLLLGWPAQLQCSNPTTWFFCLQGCLCGGAPATECTVLHTLISNGLLQENVTKPGRLTAARARAEQRVAEQTRLQAEREARRRQQEAAARARAEQQERLQPQRDARARVRAAHQQRLQAQREARQQEQEAAARARAELQAQRELAGEARRQRLQHPMLGYGRQGDFQEADMRRRV